MAENEISRHEYFEQKIDRYIYELDGALLHERTTKFDTNEADEFKKNVSDILQGISTCTDELIKENFNEKFDPNQREPEL